MPDPVTNEKPTVLHIAADASDIVAPMEHRLVEAGLHVETGADVYQGLVRLARLRSLCPRGVVVCVDALEPAEFEFFELAARVCPGIRVWVYAHPQFVSAVEKAIESGATGEVTDAVLLSLASAQPIATAPKPQVEGQTIGCAESASEPPVHDATDATIPTGTRRAATGEDRPDSVEPVEKPAPPVPEPVDVDCELDARLASACEKAERPVPPVTAADAPVRVPWLQYGNGPARKPPSGNIPPSPGQTAEEEVTQPVPDVCGLRRSEGSADPAAADRPVANHDDLDGHAPLLSDEELRALIGDTGDGAQDHCDDASAKDVLP